MIIRFSYLKQYRPNGSVFTPGSAISTYIESKNTTILPLGGTGVDAPSTILVDSSYGAQYFMNKAWSTCHAQLSAATSGDAPVNLF
jgi:hypothetical protein